MRIINVSPYHHVRGGSDSYFLAQNRLFAEHGIEVAPFCTRTDRDLPSPWSDYFIAPVELTNPGLSDIGHFIYSREARRNLRRLIQAFKPDIVHLHIYYGHFTGSILGLVNDEFGLPLVQTVHDYKPVCPVYSLRRNDQICEDCEGAKFWRAIPRRCNRHSLARTLVSVAESYVSRWSGNISKVGRFVSVSRFQADRLAALGVPAGRLRTVHNFIDATELVPRERPPATPRFVYFGRIEISKGVFDVLDVAARMPEAEFVFAGTGAAAGQLAAQAGARGLANVTVPGFVGGDDLHALVRSATATVLVPTVYENCPMSVLESLAMRVPVVGSRMGGIPELVSDGVDGLIVEPGDRDGLERAFRQLAAEPDRVAQMGEAGRQKMLDDFSPEHHYDALMAVYAELGVTP